MFSHSGQICRHIMRFLSFKSIARIPTNMIVLRWTRDANKSNDEEEIVSPMSADFENNQSMRYNHLMSDFQELASKVTCSVRGYKAILQQNAWGKALVDQYDPDEIDILDDDNDRAEEYAAQDMGLEDDDDDDEEYKVDEEEQEYLPPIASTNLAS